LTTSYGPGMATTIERPLVDTWRAFRPPPRRPEFVALPPLRKWLAVTVTVTANTVTAFLASNLFTSPFGTSNYRYLNVHRVMVYTNAITNSNTFDNVDLVPQGPDGVVTASASFRGEADDIYKRATVGYSVPPLSQLGGPFEQGDTLFQVTSSNTTLEIWVDGTYLA
jgi:hypothetical protein